MTPDVLLAQADFPRLKELVIAGTGMAYYADKDRDLAEHIAARMNSLGLVDAAAYAARLGNAGEFTALAQLLTIGETFFLRHPRQFAAICERILPDLLVRNRQSRRLRLWSAGCSTGEEAWTLAIVLARDFASQLYGWEVEILGTDLNPAALDLARTGRYREWSFRGTEPAWREANFQRHGELWEILPALRGQVRFAHHNLVTQPFATPFADSAAADLILCRNVLIYFNREAIRSLITDFRRCLAPGGWLVVGPAENDPELFRELARVPCAEATLYHDSAAPVAAWTPPTLAAALQQVPGGLPQDIAAEAGARSTPAVTADDAQATELAATLRRHADGGDWSAAIALCRRQLDRDHGAAQWHFHLGMMLAQQGEMREAERSLRRALYLDRSFVLAHYQLGLLLAGQGQAEAAARCWRNALQSLVDAPDDCLLPAGDGMSAADLRRLLPLHQAPSRIRAAIKDER